MKWYKLVAPAAVGLIAGAVIGKKVKDQWLIPEVALNRVKEMYKEDGPISGSWIMMQKEPYEKDGETYTVYRGGISRNIDGVTSQYQFKVNAKNGEILSTGKVS
ncbi:MULTISPECIES: PepSY domain-containing protein [Allobacillus]|uniref:Peptidase M4 n=1 Tax=Allobacillus halotolerans TaxID=570278 RepID=A0ABS6GMF7_9BACI|nr:MULTISPECIES: peptidase M4 [Allobacillus]MBU6080271.1 peptidase M4 [Allobacillus halotolerans]TSJ68474.1 peptidase M4 [Allobacillus sp. SKP2-8]